MLHQHVDVISGRVALLHALFLVSHDAVVCVFYDQRRLAADDGQCVEETEEEDQGDQGQEAHANPHGVEQAVSGRTSQSWQERMSE